MLKALIVSMLVGVLSHPREPADRKVSPPPAPFTQFSVTTNNVPPARIAGVVLPAKGKAKGTLFLCHGWGRSKETFYGWDWIRREQGWNLVLFDFREHGQSTRSPMWCTLGFHEIWDVKAVVDYAQQQKLAGPYAVYGNSLGASVGLRWAARDERIKGVLALSPYRNGLVGARQFLRASTGLVPPTRTDTRRGFLRMLDTVDLPTDVRARDDLRIWILCGQYDCFPEPDQRAILRASPSPASYKRLFLIPGGTHNRLWAWKGDARVPSHDQIIREFLATCEKRQ
jgi:pimeloyl-ACP methyl ester carboxylesterase